MTQHARARPPTDLRPTDHAAGTWRRPPWAGHAHASTFKHASSALQTSRRIDATRPAAVIEHHWQHATNVSHCHQANQPSRGSRPHAKSTAPSTLSVSHHVLKPTTRTAASTRRLEAHRMGKAWPRHGRALPAARAHVWDINRAAGLGRRARFSSQGWPRSPRSQEERRHSSSSTHDLRG